MLSQMTMNNTVEKVLYLNGCLHAGDMILKGDKCCKDSPLSAHNMVLEGELVSGSGGISFPIYDGEYIVIPKVDAQELETKNKSLLENVEVLAIPYESVSNPSGGLTITIGGY